MRIRTRVFLALLISGLSVVLITALLVAGGFKRGLEQYLMERTESRLEELAEYFSAYYAGHRAWPDQIERMAGPDGGRSLPRRLSLLDAQHNPLLGGENLTPRQIDAPVIVEGRTVGFLSYPYKEPIYDPIDERFREQQLSYLLMACAVALLLAVLVSWWLARQLVRPVMQVVGFAQRLATGDYDQRLPRGSDDELGQLIAATNHLAETLGQAELARDRWLADISHELRTPIAILQGEIEALIDGVRQPDAARLESLHQEVRHLQKLLDDLHTLALADAGTLRYHFETLDPARIIRGQTDLFEPYFRERDVELAVALDESATMNGDPERLRQLVANLLSNTLKYTAPGGRAEVTLSRAAGRWQLTISDSAPGVRPEDCARLFERLFRLESSRNRAQGGSGLGLAICQRIVAAHGGEIHAEPSPLGGLHIQVTFPEVLS